jgi:hypothetical protein
MELYLADWEALLRELDSLFGDLEQSALWGAAHPLVEILPIQMFTLVMANRKALQARKYRKSGCYDRA